MNYLKIKTNGLKCLSATWPTPVFFPAIGRFWNIKRIFGRHCRLCPSFPPFIWKGILYRWYRVSFLLIFYINYCRCTRWCGTSAPRCCASVASVARWLLPEKYKKSGERTNKFAPSPLFLYFSPHGSLFHAKKVPQCPILPGSCPPSTFGAGRLYFCVRYGNRCGPSAIITKLI